MRVLSFLVIAALSSVSVLPAGVAHADGSARNQQIESLLFEAGQSLNAGAESLINQDLSGYCELAVSAFESMVNLGDVRLSAAGLLKKGKKQSLFSTYVSHVTGLVANGATYCVTLEFRDVPPSEAEWFTLTEYNSQLIKNLQSLNVVFESFRK